MAKTSDPQAPRAKSTTPTVTPKSSEASKAAAARKGPPRQPGVERRTSHPIRAKHGYIQLILTQQVPHLGSSGDLVKVKPGYARNYLVPQGLATFATANNLRLVEKHHQRIKELEEARCADLQNLAAQIAQCRLQSRQMPTPKDICTARSMPIRSPRLCVTRGSRFCRKTSESKVRSRSSGCIRSAFISRTKSKAKSSFGSYRLTWTKQPAS